jgi:hypothetical protein
MKNTAILLVTLAFLGCSRNDTAQQKEGAGELGIAIPQSLLQTRTPDESEVLIEVNGKALTRGEAMRQMDMRLGGPPPADMPDGRADMIRSRVLSQVVDQFVKRTLLLEEADRLGIKATDEEIAMGLDKIKATTPEGKSPQGILKDGPAGEDSLRNEVIIGIRIDKLVAKVLPAVAPLTDDEINAFIAKHKDSLTHPEKGLMPREEITKLIQRRNRAKALAKHVRELLKAADVHHSPSVHAPKLDAE